MLFIFIIIPFFTVLCNMTVCSETPKDLVTLCSSYLPNDNNLEITPIAIGCTDEKFRIKTDSHSYLIKFFGEQSPNPSHEIKAHLIAAKKGIAPRIHFSNPTTLLMDFVAENTLSIDQAKEPLFLDKIACAIQKINAMTKKEKFVNMDIFGTIQKNFEHLNPQESLIPIIAQAKNQFNLLMYDILAHNKSLVFCHGDLHPRNIFFTNQKIVLIDWSDGGMNYPFFDLASIAVFCCLADKHEISLLTHYLKKEPTYDEISYFQSMKKIVRIYDALRFLTYIQDQNVSLVKNESVRDFADLQTIWVEDETVATDVEFLCEFGHSQLQEFLKQ
jgi:hypothetical protein